jgi:hypothetical protein
MGGCLTGRRDKKLSVSLYAFSCAASLGFGSYTEFKAVLCLIYRADFYDIEEQLASLPFNHPRGAPSEHFFDFRFTTKRAGRGSVKPGVSQVRYTYQATIDSVRSRDRKYM